MKEAKTSKIQKFVLEVLDTYLKNWKPSSQTIEIFTNGVLKIVNENPKLIEDPYELRQVIKKYIKNSILRTCSHNPNTNLMKVFFIPYQDYYTELNQFLDLEDSTINRLLFVHAVLNTLLEGTNVNFKSTMKSRISMYYQLNRKSYETQTGIKRPKNFKKYYESKYHGDSKLFQEMLSYLKTKEQEEILTATYMSTGFTEAFQKINNGIKVYFLLTYLNYPNEEKKHLIQDAMDSKNTNIILKKLQTEYVRKFHVSLEELLDKLNQRTKNIEFRYLSVFLGLDIYNLEDGVNASDVSTIIQRATFITKRLATGQIRKGLYNYFLYDSIDDINYAVKELKEKRPMYYDIVVKKHGDTFKEMYPLSTNDNNIYINGIKMMRKTISRIERERKKMLKKSLKESLSMLYLIKERRRNTSVQELSQKYSISKEQIGTLFANHLLLFGSMIPEVIQELNDLNIPIENSKHYQFYQEYTLQKNARS